MRKKENIEKVYAASLTVFGEFGFKKTTMEDIATKLGMTKGNLYLYAKNKKDLYRNTVSHALLKWQNLVRQRVEQETSPKEQFLVMCQKAVDYLSHDEDFRKVLVRDPDIFPMFSSEDSFSDINRNSVEMIKVIIERGIKENLFRSVNAEKISEVVFSIYKMFIIRAYVKEEDKVIQQMYEETVALLTTGLFIETNAI